MAARLQTYGGRNLDSARAAGDQIGEKLFRPGWPGDIERNRRVVLFDDELETEEAAALPLGVNRARHAVQKARGWREREAVAIVERQAVGGPCDEAGKKTVAARA